MVSLIIQESVYFQFQYNPEDIKPQILQNRLNFVRELLILVILSASYSTYSTSLTVFRSIELIKSFSALTIIRLFHSVYNNFIFILKNIS